MMHSLRAITLLFCLLLLVSSCYKQYSSPGAYDTLFEEKSLDLSPLAEHGERYQKRGDNLRLDGFFRPELGESYEHYRQRLINTLAVQEHDIQELKKSIGQKKQSICDLKEQVTDLHSQHVDLRLALASLIDGNDQESQKKVLFHQYTVQKGDTLQSISKRWYGTCSGWLSIYRFNQNQLPHGPNKIEVEQTLFIPDPKHTLADIMHIANPQKQL